MLMFLAISQMRSAYEVVLRKMAYNLSKYPSWCLVNTAQKLLTMPINPHLRIAPYHSETFLMLVNSWVLRRSALPEICIISVFNSVIVYILRWVFLDESETSIGRLMFIYDYFQCKRCLIIKILDFFSFVLFSSKTQRLSRLKLP